MITFTYRADREITAAFHLELARLLAFYYPHIRIRRPDKTSILVSSDDDIDGNALRSVIDHFRSEFVESSVSPFYSCASVDDGSVATPCDHCFDARIPVGDGIFLQDEAWADDLDRLLSILRRHMQECYGAKFFRCPSLIRRTTLERAGYFRHLPNAVSLISNIRNSYWSTQAICERSELTNDDLHQNYELSPYVLNPVTCYHVWDNVEQLGIEPDEVVCLEGKVYRHEGYAHSRTRLAEFLMLETVGMGSEEFIVTTFDRFRANLSDFFERLSVPFEYTPASDCFVGPDHGIKRAAQIRTFSKYEFRAPKQCGDIAFASVNMHGGVYTSEFLPTTQKISNSCCAGVGIDRLLYVMRKNKITF